ncbi:response regulator [Aliidiomarina soli]|uniref:Response regulator n=1 Tax=Aliidiomarina soli TaxID=1928574 RepID=A0A432WCY1_9GAMM|nr:response regulator [Aliidiomarina soli]RUO30271.1 response regulator [Aliidiomarina soli]
MLNTRVLLIEDDLVFQQLVERFLEQRGYQVTCADDGEQGWNLVQQGEFDIVLCDLNLPGLSGLEVLERLLHSYAQLPVIVISASERMSDIREAVRLGAWDYLVKPVEHLETLDVAIQNCLHRNSLEASWEHERWELDDHIDVLFDSDKMSQQLSDDLTPHEPLQIGPFEITHHLDDQDSDAFWVDYHRLPDNKAIAVMANAQALAGQSLLSLLVLKTIFNPIVRAATTNHPEMLANPHKILERLNAELCHSKMKSAFDMVLLWLDGDSGAIHWGHAGDSLRISMDSKPDLALGIWAHASFKAHHGQVADEGKLSIGNDRTMLSIMRPAAVSAA